MFDKQWMKLGSTAMLLLATLLVGGCATTPSYRAIPEDTRDLSLVQARNLLMTTIEAGPASLCKPLRVTYKAFKCGPLTYVYSKTPTLFEVNGGFGDVCVSTTGDINHAIYFWSGASARANARDFARAWYVLAREAPAFFLAQEAAFERDAQTYRDAQVKPQLPEEVVRFKVQAELAVQQKRFDDAVDLYDQALSFSPWWPAGYYNRGLILGELQDYEEGIRSLRKYLKLEPDAANARAVQLKIYQWESLVPPAAG